ncbi:MAG: hypothetical protein M9916_07990 [Crocinitomicaceae bacterium]|nr:hypothetical protein [Crocinitomicaceae bacterium]
MGLLQSCSNEVSNEKEHITVDQKDTNSSFNTRFDGKIFSIPSPILTMLLLKKIEPNFQSNLLNSSSKVDSYQTEYKRALILGVYGADLGYSSVYKDKKQIMDYIVTVEKLTKSLGLESAFDKSFVERYQKHTDNSDSMMHIVSDAFKNADLFLKNDNRKSVSSLILAGGWIESLHFASSLLDKKNNDELIERIGEQKQTLLTLTSLLEENNKENESDKLISDLKELNKIFENISVDYQYAEPVTNSEKHLTELKHSIKFSINDETLSAIKTQITKIRNYLID